MQTMYKYKKTNLKKENKNNNLQSFKRKIPKNIP